MIRNLLIALLFLFAFAGNAQVSRPVVLDEALNLALSNSTQLKKARLEKEGIKQRLRLERGASFPQVDAEVRYDYNPVLQTQFLPGDVLGMPGTPYVPVQFGQPWALTGSIQVEQVVYSEAGRRALPAVGVTRNLYDILLERSEEEVLYQTAKVFYQTLQTEQLLRAVNANFEKFDALQRMVDLQLKNGFAIPTDVKRVRVARTNLETQRQNLLSGITALRQTLQFLCGVPFDEPFEPIAANEIPGADSSRWQTLTYALESTTEFRLLERQIELYNIQWKSQRAEGVPTLAIHAAAYYQTQRADARVFDPKSTWYGMATVGVKIKVPLFDGFRRHRKADLLRLEGQKLEADRTQLTGAKELEFRQTHEQFENALRLLNTQNENVGLAREIADKLILQYKEGVTPLSDVLNAQTLLSEAETNYWQQVFSYKLAVLNLLKAAGRLEEIRK